MSSIYALANGGPWSADDDGITCDGYLNKSVHRLATPGNGPTVDGVNVNVNRQHDKHGGLVRGSDTHLTRSRNA